MYLYPPFQRQGLSLDNQGDGDVCQSWNVLSPHPAPSLLLFLEGFSALKLHKFLLFIKATFSGNTTEPQACVCLCSNNFNRTSPEEQKTKTTEKVSFKLERVLKSLFFFFLAFPTWTPDPLGLCVYPQPLFGGQLQIKSELSTTRTQKPQS